MVCGNNRRRRNDYDKHHKKNKNYVTLAPHLAVSNSSKLVIDKVEAIAGRAYESFESPRNSKWRLYWLWRLESYGLKDILEKILPYLTCKKYRAEWVLQFIKEREKEGKQKHYGPKLHKIAEKVWEANAKGK